MTLFPFQKSMRDALKDPEIIPTDFAKFEEPYQHHICSLALGLFEVAQGRLPKPYNAEDNATFLAMCSQANETHALGYEVSNDELNV